MFGLQFRSDGDKERFDDGSDCKPLWGPRRTEAYFLHHVEAVIASDATAQRWRFVVDNLDTHRSESLVRRVSRWSGLDLELGKKGSVRQLPHACQNLHGH